MVQEFDSQRKIHLTRDSQGTARDLLHVEEPYESAAGTALVAAREYLEKFGGVLGIAPSELSNFGLPAETSPVDAGVEYRFDQEKAQFDTTTVVLAQTYFGLPVWEAGVAVHMRQRPFVVLSAQSTRHVSVEAEMPSAKALARIKELDPSTLARQLGLPPPRKEPVWSQLSSSLRKLRLPLATSAASDRRGAGSSDRLTLPMTSEGRSSRASQWTANCRDSSRRGVSSEPMNSFARVSWKNSLDPGG